MKITWSKIITKTQREYIAKYIWNNYHSIVRKLGSDILVTQIRGDVMLIDSKCSKNKIKVI